MATNITEGQEYQITMNGKVIFEGIAESDTDAADTLESYALHASASNNSTKPITFKIVKL